MVLKEKFCDVFSWLLIALAVLVAAIRIFGFVPYYVMSPSMTPTYMAGDLIFVKSEPPDNIVVGDVITYLAADDKTVVTHRVYDIQEKEHSFTTKGDANVFADIVPVSYDRVLGVVKFSIPHLGFLSAFLSTRSGVLGVLTIILLISLISTLKTK